jgi:hypothetical protein
MAREKLPWGIGVVLLEGPMTLEELTTAVETSPFVSSSLPRTSRMPSRHRRRMERLSEDVAALVQAGWVVQQGDHFALTELGKIEVDQLATNARSMMEAAVRMLRALGEPKAASVVTLAAQALLALLKLPAGLLSGSVGLINDSIDTLLDLLSSLLVYLGVRFDRERLVSILLVVFMLGTGAFTLYEAVNRFLVPYVPRVGWFPFAVAISSAIAGAGLWTYQRYVGLKSGLMSFVAESVDSRNHIFVALGVTAGLAASLLHFGLLDMFVGLAVAALILWSAIELALALVRSSPERPLDLSHYGFWVEGVYEQQRDAYFRDWMLFLVDRGEAQTRGDLAAQLRQVSDLRDNPWLRAVGLNRQIMGDTAQEESLDSLFCEGWVLDQKPLALTSKGRKQLRRRIGRHRRH